MADVAPEVKETVVEKEVKKVEKPEVTESEKPAEESPAKTEEKNGDAAAEESTEEKNGDAAAEESTTENGVEDKCLLKNGSVKQNGVTEKESESNESTESNEVCGIKRKSVGLESDEAEVESSEKKQKITGSAEPDVAANGDVEAKA